MMFFKITKMAELLSGSFETAIAVKTKIPGFVMVVKADNQCC